GTPSRTPSGEPRIQRRSEALAAASAASKSQAYKALTCGLSCSILLNNARTTSAGDICRLPYATESSNADRLSASCMRKLCRRDDPRGTLGRALQIATPATRLGLRKADPSDDLHASCVHFQYPGGGRSALVVAYAGAGVAQPHSAMNR